MAAPIVQEVQRLTGISDEALGRKLGVAATVVRRWADGAEPIPEATAEVLRVIVDRARNGAPSGEPRVKAPHVETGVVAADSVAYLDTLPDDSVDLILSDIPYGIGLDDWDVLHRNTNSAYLGVSAGQERAGSVFKRRRKPINGWSAADREIPRQYYEWCSSWAGQWLRVLKPGASAIVFAGRRLAHRATCALEDAGFNHRDMLGWRRRKAVFRAQRLSVVLQRRGELAEADRWQGWRVGNLRPVFEPILWCFKPYAVTIADNMLDYHVGAYNLAALEQNTGARDNIIDCDFAPGEGGLHEAQKPVELLQTLIELCTSPGQIVLDPFAGSGSTAVAAAASDRRCLVIERDEKLCALIRERLGSVAD